uniref:Uncharacterized protein n=1 Tax=Arundo donax TaxID=35708 RepID=A0A0A9GWC3_ARUDO
MGSSRYSSETSSYETLMLVFAWSSSVRTSWAMPPSRYRGLAPSLVAPPHSLCCPTYSNLLLEFLARRSMKDQGAVQPRTNRAALTKSYPSGHHTPARRRETVAPPQTNSSSCGFCSPQGLS